MTRDDSPRELGKRTSATSPAPPQLIAAAVDGTPRGRDAVVLASSLARTPEAELLLIAVREEPLLAVALPREMSWRASEHQAQAMLAETRDALAPMARLAVESDTLVWRGLRRAVRREHRDLLVVGSRQGSRAGAVVLGRNARELLGRLECPLAVAPSGLSAQTDFALRRIGVGFDASNESRAALRFASSLAAAAGAELQRLELEAGDPRQVLRDLCVRVDLLVIGSGHRSRAGRVDVGHTGRALLDGARCPVVVVPRPTT